MVAIYKKELNLYFKGISGYVFIGIYLLIYSFFFIAYNILGDNADIGTMLDNIVVSFVLLVPILTMRLFAEEKHMRTDKIYLASPLKAWQIVIGKYLAAYTVFAMASLVTLVSGIIMVFLGGQTFWEVIAIFVGYILIGGVFISAGMFMSTLAENQIVAAILSFALCLLLYLADLFKSALSGTVFEKAVELVAITDHYDNFIVGIFDIPAVVYFLSLASVFVMFSIIKEESTRWN